MHRRNMIMTGMVALLTSAAVFPGAAHAQTAKDLVGTWTLVSNVNIQPDGTRVDTFGPNPSGLTIFEPSGRFIIVQIRRGLPKFKSNNRLQGTPEENQAIVAGTMALFGSYSVSDKVINLKVDDSTWPAWAGTEQKRNITFFANGEIKWMLPQPTTGGGQNELTYRRIE